MVLFGVQKNGNWLSSRWNLTYMIGWEKILKAVSTLSMYYDALEILVDGKQVEVSSKEDILNLEEASQLIIRGNSKIIKYPIMITFYNQLQIVDVSVPCMSKEFEEADYEKFSKSLGQYMDSIEITMYDK